MNKYKIIATDFDDTLLTNDKKVTKNTQNTLLRYKENGYYIIGATSRNLLASNSFMDINIFNYLILNNGSNIYDVKEQKCIYNNVFNKKDVKDLYNEYKNICKNMIFSSLNHYYILNNIHNKLYNKKLDNSIINKDVVKLNIFFEDNYDLENEINKLKDKYKNLNIFIMKTNNNGNWITIIPNNINKLYTLSMLCNMLKINIKEIIYFGDSTNDIDAISKCGLGVAMENSQEEVKKCADYITTSNMNDGIATFLNKYEEEL